MFVGSRGKAGFVPLSDEQMYTLLIEKPPEGAPVKLPTEGLAAVYRERLAEFGGPVAAARELITDDEAVVYRPVEALIVDAPWYRGRVLLVGDAAHATSPHVGQGRGAGDRGRGRARRGDRARRRGPRGVRSLHGAPLRALQAGRRGLGGDRRLEEQGHSLPIDPVGTRNAVTMAAMAPI